MLTVRIPFNQRWRRLLVGRYYIPFKEWVEGPAELYVFNAPDRITVYNQEIELVGELLKREEPAAT